MMANPEMTAMVVAQHHNELQRHADHARLVKAARASQRGQGHLSSSAHALRGFRARIFGTVGFRPAQPGVEVSVPKPA